MTDSLGARFAELEAALDAHAVAHNEEQTTKQKEVFTLMLNTHNRERQCVPAYRVCFAL